MLRDKLLIIVNLLLVAVCGACAYYLATAQYQAPLDVNEAHGLIAGDESRTRPDVSLPHPPVNQEVDQLKGKLIFNPLFTPPPTPTPTPAPPPPPPNLESAVYGWAITSLSKGKAIFLDQRNNNDLVQMTVGGPPHDAKDKDNRPLQVTLREVNLKEMKAVLEYADQVVEKKF